MVQRIVLLKLNEEHADPKGRAELAESARTVLARVRGVVGVRAGPPADEASAGSWDLILLIELESMDIYPAYAADPVHCEWLETVLAPRCEFKKAWNFTV